MAILSLSNKVMMEDCPAPGPVGYNGDGELGLGNGSTANQLTFAPMETTCRAVWEFSPSSLPVWPGALIVRSNEFVLVNFHMVGWVCVVYV